MTSTEEEDTATVLPELKGQEAFSNFPEHGTKTIHFIRHAEGQHNAANRDAGNDTPVLYSTLGSWRYQDACLTAHGIEQCVQARETLLHNVRPELIVVSPFTRTLQTAHIMFGGKGIPFLVQDACRERSGMFTCDKRRTKTEIVHHLMPLYASTNDQIDFDRFGYPTEDDTVWTQEREASTNVVQRGIDFVQWLATRPEMEIAVVTHSSFLKHLFQRFGEQVVAKDQQNLHRLAGNAEIRSICLALHRGFYPEGHWDNGTFIPDDPSFRRGRWAPNNDAIAAMHTMATNQQIDPKE